MSRPPPPIFLFADSQLLFWANHERRLLQSIRDDLLPPRPKAAYLGASNGDDPQFYEIFLAAMDAAGIRDCRMVGVSFSRDDDAFLESADLVLLAGGDVERGLRAFARSGLTERLIRRRAAGCVMIGISAGAVQMGMSLSARYVGVFGWIPYVIAAHDEARQWQDLREDIHRHGGTAIGLGIPSGGGLVYRPAQSWEPLRHPVYEVRLIDGALHDRWIPAAASPPAWADKNL